MAENSTDAASPAGGEAVSSAPGSATMPAGSTGDASEAKKVATDNAGSGPESSGDDAVTRTSQTDENSRKKGDMETGTDATAESSPEEKPDGSSPTAGSSSSPKAIVSSSKKSRPPYKYNPDKITLRFLFANKDGLTVTVECNPGDTVGEVKGALLSVWPEDLPNCSGGDRLRLVCMGKGYLMPDTRTLEDCQVPVFKTHPTPINVSVVPEPAPADESDSKKKKNDGGGSGGGGRSSSSPDSSSGTSQGCACAIL